MLERLRNLMARWHDLKEVDALTDRDLDDLGMTRAQMEDFVRMPADVPERVAAMARIFGVSEQALKANHGQYVEVLQSCGHCADRGACALVLEREELSRPKDAGFCGNRQTFADLAARPAA